MVKKRVLRGAAAFALALGPVLTSPSLAIANDQQDAYNSAMAQYQLLWSQGKIAEANAAYSQAQAAWQTYQSCLVSNTCTNSSVPQVSQSPAPAPVSSQTPTPSTSASSSPTPPPVKSPTPAPSSSSSGSQATVNSPAPLMSYEDYVKEIQALDQKIVTSTGSERTALLEQKNNVITKYQSDNQKAQQKYVAVQKEYVEQLAVITARNQAEAQAQLIQVAKDQAINAGVSSERLTSWTDAQTQLQSKVEELEKVISGFETMYTAESIAGMTVESVDQTVATAIAYQNELKQESLTLSSLAITSISKVDSSALTNEQKNVLVSAANIGFEYAEQGSAIYNQSLEALYLVAESDDPTLRPELAAIPVIGQALEGVLEAFNTLGNVGSDMSPQVREQSEKVVVSAVIVGQVTQVAVGASTVAANAASMASATMLRRP